MSVNKIFLLGNVGNEPRIFKGENYTVASFSLATTKRGFKTQSGVEIPERTTWHNVVVKGGLASVVERFVKKGSPLFVEGEMTYREYEKDGAKQLQPEVVATEIQLLNSKQ